MEENETLNNKSNTTEKLNHCKWLISIVIPLLSFILFIGCQVLQIKKSNHRFDRHAALVGDMKYDVYELSGFYTMPDGTQQAFHKFDSVLRRNELYNASKYYHFEVIALHKNDTILSGGIIEVFGSDIRRPESKTQVLTLQKYSNFPNDTAVIKHYINNSSLTRSLDNNFEWQGIIENNREVWEHPMQENIMNITETVGFPNFRHSSCYIGASWTSTINTSNSPEFWGDWSNKAFHSVYHITDTLHREVGIQSLLFWKIEVETTYDDNKNRAIYYFNEKVGFAFREFYFYDDRVIFVSLKSYS